jgi:hypothetical protein
MLSKDVRLIQSSGFFQPETERASWSQACAGSDGFEMRRRHAIKPARHRASDSLFGDRRGPVGSCVGSFRIICA